KISHWLDVCSVAFKTPNRNVPGIDVGQRDEINLGLGIPGGVCHFPMSCRRRGLNRCLVCGGSDLCRRLGFGGCRRSLAIAFAETGLEIVADGCLGMQRSSSGNENFLRFDIVWISNAAVHRADGRTRFIVVKSDAFGA